MRIGYFVTLFPCKCENIQTYGAGRAAHYLCKELAKKGHEIHVFVPFIRNLTENDENMTVHFYSSVLSIGIANISFKLFSDPLNYNLDIVHIHGDTPISVLAGLRCAAKRKRPFVVTWHGDWIANYGSIIRRIGVHLSNKYLVDEVLSRAKAIVTPSKYYVEESRFLKKYKSKVTEIPNGIDFEDFNIPYSREECRKILGFDNTKSIVLFLSALYPPKGPHILLKAIPRITRKHEDTIFVFAGGRNVSEYRKLSEELEVQKCVKFTGYVEERLKPLYYRAADVFCLPSTMSTEVFPLVLLEASAAGLPMVVSDLNTFKCIIEDGCNGIFTKRGDEKSLADAIIHLLENEDVRKRMGNDAKEKVKNYSWDWIAKQTEKVYDGLVL